jgi:hypothetical protein
MPTTFIGLETRLAAQLRGEQGHERKTPTVILTYLTADCQSWVIYAAAVHPISPAKFEAMWNLHPLELGRNEFRGRSVVTPRYFRAYGRAYSFSGQTSPVLPLADAPLAEAALRRVASLLHASSVSAHAAAGKTHGAATQADCGGKLGAPNGVLVNWYAASHSIGLHRDDTRELLPYAPVWSVSWGHRRTFRLRPRDETGRASPSGGGFDSTGCRAVDFELGHGDLLVM